MLARLRSEVGDAALLLLVGIAIGVALLLFGVSFK